jgi:RND family efflux transporter MFP subunit
MQQVLRNRRFIVATLAVLVIGSSALLTTADDAASSDPFATVQRGEFKVVVNATGELIAPKFVAIKGPEKADRAGQGQMKIASIIPEGTVVQAGDIVAELDRSTIASRLNDATIALQKAEAQYEQAALDSVLKLATALEEIRTLELGLEEKSLAKQAAKYEAPTTQRQAEIDYEKAQRALAQAKVDYVIKQRQADAKLREVGADVQRQRGNLAVVQEVMEGFTVRAPASGMLIYMKEWNGKKKAVGSQIYGWDPTVATLPDLSVMESQTWVNEIDVRRIAVGQHVRLSLDSDPSRTLSGEVAEVANVGEERANSDAKVFEVRIKLLQSDTTLRPGMTTLNRVETRSVPNALFVPAAAVVTDSGVKVVYKKDGDRVVRQVVETGAASDEQVVILRGLSEGDRVLLGRPRPPKPEER